MSIVTTAYNIRYGNANMDLVGGELVNCWPEDGTGVEGFDAAGVGGRKSIGDRAGEALWLNVDVDTASRGEGAAMDGP